MDEIDLSLLRIRNAKQPSSSSRDYHTPDKKIEQMTRSIIQPSVERIKHKMLAEYDPMAQIKVGAFKPISQTEKVKHSRMHTISVNNWFKTRHFKTVSNKYLYYPEEIKKRQNLMSIFDNFDEDGNHMLDLNEFLDMFIGTYIYKDVAVRAEGNVHFIVRKNTHESMTDDPSKIEQIREYLSWNFKRFYEFVTKKDYLTKEEFILLAVDKKANEYFESIMKSLSVLLEELGVRTERVIPFSFEKMISYLGYSSKRDQLYKGFLNNKDQNIHHASKQLEDILLLKADQIKEEFESNEKLQKYRSKTSGAQSKKGGLHIAAMGLFLSKFLKRTDTKDSLQDPPSTDNFKDEEPRKSGLSKLLKVDTENIKHLKVNVKSNSLRKNNKMSENMKQKIKEKIKKDLLKAKQQAKYESTQMLSKVTHTTNSHTLDLIKQQLFQTPPSHHHASNSSLRSRPLPATSAASLKHSDALKKKITGSLPFIKKQTNIKPFDV